MAYKIPIIHKAISLIVICLLQNVGHAQNCVITKMDSMPYHINQHGLIEKLYDSIKKDNSSTNHILLIQSFLTVNKTIAYYLSFNEDKKIKAVILNVDSVLYSKIINGSNVNEAIFSTPNDTVNMFLTSNCNNTISFHKVSVLVFSNRVKTKWIEYTSLDGYMKETLEENKNYILLNKLYRFIVSAYSNSILYKLE